MSAHADDLVDVVKRVKPAVVAVGTFEQTRSPSVDFRGTGFVVGDGLSVITNAHVLPPALDEARKETLGIFTGDPAAPRFRQATVEAIDREHDLAHLRIGGQPLPTMPLQDSDAVEEGQTLAFTGFPLGLLLGLRHVTHRALLSAKTPISVPATSAKQLDAKMIAQMQRSPFAVFQLDATAYPGSSGSPLYDPSTGGVVGIINMVYVKGMKENAISNPSGITYAIPSNYIRKLMANK
ncbi:trypsin-like peptidase domain-containing protein [Noviherbaspirillum sp. DKR-6]|uniref:Trypsin-like peptidase domain-containing protein n=2 Tax=Noviherbaspirillum pedocola TaxID=2801341 RepID=A0A934W6G2_9BURK|nr:trypsin-like peptidase domain-containing protein [Noviherbaspirillum pedocola]